MLGNATEEGSVVRPTPSLEETGNQGVAKKKNPNKDITRIKEDTHVQYEIKHLENSTVLVGKQLGESEPQNPDKVRDQEALISGTRDAYQGAGAGVDFSSKVSMEEPAPPHMVPPTRRQTQPYDSWYS